MSFTLDDVRLPENYSQGSSGGPEWLTDQVPTSDGDSWVEQRWLHPLHRYDIAHNIKTAAAMAALKAFHNARRGAKFAFLFKDWLDFTSAADGDSARTMLDQPLGTGTGALTTFQLIKRYPDAVRPYDRPIKWPVTGSLVVAVNGVLKGSGVSVVRGTGIVTLTPAPAAAAVITAGYQFDVPVHFEEDRLPVSYDTINSRSAGSIMLEEVRSWL
jgi:uncharacterized protein (TIGR02217 family)